MGLATIKKVLELKPIPNADFIEVAKIDGWEVIVKKGSFEPGSLCVYFEIDSFLPDIEVFGFLKSKKKMNDVEGYRLRTIKMKGQISQGLALPLTDFPILQEKGIDMEGADVSELLGVLKYEKPVPAQLRGQAKGYFPSFIRKTDEERVQNFFLADLIELLDEPFVQTEKRDGSSMTVYVYKDVSPIITTEVIGKTTDGEPIVETKSDSTPRWVTGVCSRNLDLKESDDNAFWKTAKELDLINKLLAFAEATGSSIALQGELYGEGIQNNPHKIKGLKFELFNIWDIDKQQYLPPLITFVTSKRLGVECVPGIRNIKTLRKFINGQHEKIVETLLELADENYELRTLDGISYNEGHVYKSLNPIGNRILSFKVISNKYLLSVEE